MDARRATLVAFLAFTAIAGLNFVAVRVSNRELPPFWGAALRFAVAGALFLALALARRAPFPRGKALAGALVFGVLSFGASYALAYYALVRAPAAVAAVAVALAPLMTLFLASAHGVERIRARGLVGALVALVGIALVFSQQLVGAQVPLLSLGALLLMTLCLSEASVLIKRFPPVDPLAMNAIAMALGAALLALLSLGAGETWSLPRTMEARVAVAYLIVVGSVAMFFLYLFVLARWTASATSYQTVLSPIVTVLAAAALAGERVDWALVVGGALVLAGVYVGALHGARPPTPPGARPGAPPPAGPTPSPPPK